MIHRDDAERPVAVQRAPFPGELDRALIRLRPAIGQEDVIQPAMRRDQVRQPDHLVVVEGRAAIDQLARLGRQRVQDRPRRVAKAVHRPALDEVEVAPPLGIDQP